MRVSGCVGGHAGLGCGHLKWAGLPIFHEFADLFFRAGHLTIPSQVFVTYLMYITAN